jgi:glycerate 2-kinase
MDTRAIKIWRAGVDAVGGYNATRTALQTEAGPAPDRIIAVGKAAGDMARAALDHHGSRPTLVVTKDGHAEGLPDHVHVIESAHPVPDPRSLTAGRTLRSVVQDMAPDAHLLLLVSGGASSLAEDLAPGRTLDDLQALNRRLLSEGLDITAMNAERRKISRIKGGGLLSGFPGRSAQVLAISDVPGDDLAVIGSGIGTPPDPCPLNCTTAIIASNTIARDAAADAAESLGLSVLDNAESLHDDLPALASRIGARLREMPKGVLILGGEPTVILPQNPGRGGRNQALALALAREIAGLEDLTIVVGGTDGSDGPTDAAGGIVDGTTWATGAAEALDAADSGSFLEHRGALFTTGPTGTNVMDLLIALRD